MAEFSIHGNVLNLETHLVGYGLCAVLGSGARIEHVQDGDTFVVRVTSPLDQPSADALVVEYVRKMFSDKGVLTTENLRLPNTSDFRSPTLSPYSTTYRDPHSTEIVSKKKPDGTEEDKEVHPPLSPAEIYARRYAHESFLTDLEKDVSGALGKPAYWRDANQEGSTQLVYYASNSGRDLLLLNVVKPASYLSDASDKDIIDGISSNGARVHTDSDWTTEETTAVRSALGVYGLSAFPTVARMGAGSVTASVVSFKTKNVNLAAHAPGYVVIPSFSAAVSIAKVRSIVSDAAWLGDSARDRLWRKEQGVVGRYVFRAVDKGAEQAETRRFSNGFPLNVAAKVHDLVR